MMFHVKRFVKCIYALVALTAFIFISGSCSAPRQAIDVSDYVLRGSGKPVLGHEEGLTAFIFENNPKKIAFQQFITYKYQLGNTSDLEFFTTIGGKRFRILVYDNAEIEKYFRTSDFIAANVEPDPNVVGSKVKFLAVSVIDDYNEDCLSTASLYQNITIEFLLGLKKEYYNL